MINALLFCNDQSRQERLIYSDFPPYLIILSTHSVNFSTMDVRMMAVATVWSDEFRYRTTPTTAPIINSMLSTFLNTKNRSRFFSFLCFILSGFLARDSLSVIASMG